MQEALSLLDFCDQFPVDARLAAQTYCRACQLGHTQRATAQAAPLCVLLDIAALQRRPGALAAYLRWLQQLPGLRAVRIADGGKGSSVSEEELALLLQLVTAHPEAAADLRHLSINADEMGRHFDSGEARWRTASLAIKLMRSAGCPSACVRPSGPCRLMLPLRCCRPAAEPSTP